MGRIKKWAREESNKIKNIPTFIAKVEYIWEYYWIEIVAVLFVVFFAFFSIHQYTSTIRDYWFYITYANTNADVGNDSEFYNEFLEFTGFDLSEKQMDFNNTAFFDYGKNETGNTYFESFVTYVDAGTLDAVTMPCDSMVLLGQSGRLLDLNSEECASIKEKYGDRFLYAKPFDEEYSKDLVPIGIDISDSRLMKEYHIYKESCALGIGAQTKHLDTVEKFLDFIFEEQ